MKPFIIVLCFFVFSDALIAQKNIENVNPIENCVVHHIPFNIVEKTPVFPGCTGNNNDMLKECFSSSISSFIINNFNLKHEFNENYSHGTTKIFASFIVNIDGQVTNIKIRALNKSFEKEIIRVLKKLPYITPGKQEGKNVRVLYSLPIIFDLK